MVKDLDEVDQKRDNAYQTLVNFVKAYAHVDGQAVEAAYTKLRKANSLRFIKPASASKPIQDWPKQATKQTLQAAYDYIIDLVAVLSHGQPEH